MKTQVMLIANVPDKVGEVISKCTFPTQKETAYHYPFVFTDESTFWLVFVPNLSEGQQASIADLIASRLPDSCVWWL